MITLITLDEEEGNHLEFITAKIKEKEIEEIEKTVKAKNWIASEYVLIILLIYLLFVVYFKLLSLL